jgi:hypothetical protein
MKEDSRWFLRSMSAACFIIFVLLLSVVPLAAWINHQTGGNYHVIPVRALVVVLGACVFGFASLRLRRAASGVKGPPIKTKTIL